MDPKRIYSPDMQKYYWLHSTLSAPLNNEPCYSNEEIELIKKFKDKLSKETLLAIYEIKSTVGAKLTETSLLAYAEVDPINQREVLPLCKGHNIIMDTMEIIKKAKVRHVIREKKN